jgi:lysozyme family protein
MLNLEGGKTYEKSDKGGKTNFGITQRTFNTWRDSINKPRTDVFKISQEEAKEIYKKNYWNLIKGSQLPHDIAQAIMSMALTDGPQDAIRHTQKILGIPPTGTMGPITMKSIWSAAKQKGTKKLTNYIVDKQIQRYQADEQAKTYGRGWTNRAESLRPK